MERHQVFKIENLSFSDDAGYEEYKKGILNSLFTKVRIKAFASGENAHTLPVDIEVLKRGADTVYNQPILWKYNPYIDDAMGHEKDEVPCGFVPKEDNAIRFEEDNDKTYLVIDALLWNKYSGKLIDIFKRDGNSKDVSVEMTCQTIEHEDGDEIIDYIISGITILGEWINPAVKGCKAEMIEFSEDRDIYINNYIMSESTIKINNSKDASVNGSWENPRRKLLRPILESSNKNSLLKEAYLVPDMENPTTSTCKYPHHVVRNGELVIHEGGLKAAFSRASQQGIVKGKVKSHLLKHYRELGLSTENFSEFGFSEKEFNLLFSEDGDTMDKFEKITCAIKEHECAEDVCVECAENGKVTFSCDGKKFTVDADIKCTEDGTVECCNFAWDTKKECDMAYEPDGAHKTGGVADEADDDIKDKKYSEMEEKCAELEKKCSELEVKCAELEKKCSDCEADNKAYMSQIEAMSDYEELKQFKCDAEEKAKQEEQMSQMFSVFSQIESKGISLSDKDKKTLEEKFSEFQDFSGWENFVKAFAFDNAQNVDGIVRIAYPSTEQRPNEELGVWGRIM